MIQRDTNLLYLLSSHLPFERAARLQANVRIAPLISEERGSQCSRAVLAQALNLCLLAELNERTPSAQKYFEGLESAGRQLEFDHGALRTVDLRGMGDLPPGESVIGRVLRPLGYECTEIYPLSKLNMTGRAYRHLDYPEDLPQFFVSELHVERFSASFQAAAARVTATSADPLSREDIGQLEVLQVNRYMTLEDAGRLLGKLIGCFQRLHTAPSLSDYELLLQESAEMAWIATEGNVFNHAADRVANVDEAVEQQRLLGRRLKETIEVSRSRRVRQSAFLADPIMRPFVGSNGSIIEREVPGSFFEFIERAQLPENDALDLAFDTGNAQGIFKVTAAT